MALYGTSNVSATTPNLTATATAYKTELQVSALTGANILRRAFIYEWKVGPASVPNTADCEIVWSVIRQTSATTANGVVMAANAIDAADSAATSVVVGNYSTEPTNAGEANVLDVLGANQRGSYQWQVNPGGPGELVIPAVTINGIGVRAKSSTYAGNVNVGCKFRE
jgi:hypothetical protein